MTHFRSIRDFMHPDIGWIGAILLVWRRDIDLRSVIYGLSGTDPLPYQQSVCNDLYVFALSRRPEARQAILDAGTNTFFSRVESLERLLTAISSTEYSKRKGDLTVNTENKKLYRSRDNRIIAGVWNGQRIFVFPSLDMVVVLTGGNYATHEPDQEIITRHILPAVQ